ncbi:hypothetical protein ABIE38_003504 [Dietzia sp. 2505]|uniref:hypothetical protein n=1 Tax=Dietzia sp. 2505 TaxID=3156457 RepID=UPI003393D95E
MSSLSATSEAPSLTNYAPAEVVFGTLSALEFETMTDGGVEFVLCASALTAQM